VIVKVQKTEERNAVGDILWIVTGTMSNGARFKYEGGVNADMLEAMGDRTVAYFEADLGDGGLEIGAEVQGS
jgi:hypothetical protein